MLVMFQFDSVPTTFQQIIVEIFEEYTMTFMWDFLNDFVDFDISLDHLRHPTLN